MIAEQYISLKTAQMLKEAKFDVPCRRHYTKSGSTWETAVPETIDESRDFTWFPCPTQTLAARWLREVHNIDVTVMPCEDGSYVYDILQKKKRVISSAPIDDGYEKVFEYGLHEAIKLIKK